MNDAPSYVPIVKGKMYDLLATKELSESVRAKLMPLVEAMPLNPKQSSLEGHIHRFCSSINKYLPSAPLYVDFRGISPEARVDDGTNGIVYGYTLLKALGRPVAPVFGLSRNDELWPVLGSIARDFDQGFCFRLVSDDLDDFALEETWEQIIERSAQIGLRAGRIDLLLDFRSVTGEVLLQFQNKAIDFLSYNPAARKYRSIIVAGSSALKDVSAVEEEGVTDVWRHELDLWKALWLDLPEDLRPIFSDYGIVHPDFSDVGPNENINAKIRYTAGQRIRYFRGHGLKRPVKDYGQYRALAAKVRASGIYAGASASFGDKYIDDCANGFTATPGAPSTWVKADMNRHMTATVLEIDHMLVQLEKLVATEA